jgi:PKD domain
LRARLAPIVLVATVLAGVCAPALATTQTRDRAGDVRGARGLTAAEKLALDIFRVDVRGGGDLLEVAVRLRGDAERRLGRGGLRRAAVGIVLVSKGGDKVTVASMGRGARERTIVGVPRRPRGAGAAAARLPGAAAARLPAVASARQRQIVRFFVAGYDVGSLEEIRAGTLPAPRPPRARASSDSSFVLFFLGDSGPFGDKVAGVPRSPSSVNDCGELRKLMAEASRALDGRSDRYSRPYKELSDWIDLALARFEQLCPGKSGPSVGNPGGGNPGGGGGGNSGGGGSGGGTPQPANTPPTASFTFSPANDPPTAPRAGQSIAFNGSASDPDGTIASWKWEFGDGSSQSGTGPAPSASHSYPTAGGYNARLIVTDDRGTTYATATQAVLVSGPGSKRSRVFNHPADQLFCDPGTHAFDFWVPSWAQPPYDIAWDDELCPTATKSVSIAAAPGGTPPAGEELDAHGQPTKRVRVTVTITSGSGTDAGAQLTLLWN